MNELSSLRLLITGATGFIGSRLALEARRLGIDTRATGRAEIDIEHERLEELRAQDVQLETGLLQDRAFTRRMLEGRNAVIHLAAAQHESQMPKSYFVSANVDVVRGLLAEASAAGVRRFVYGSTIGVYGDTGNSLPDEQSALKPDNIYTQTKVEAEALVREHAFSLETTIVRIGETYGPGDQRLLKLFRSIDRGRFFMIGSGENRRQCIHVNDLIRGLLLAARHPDAAGETFLLVGREVLTTNEMVARVAAALGTKPPRTRLPMWPFLLAARVMETTLQPLRIPPPLHSRRLDFFRKSLAFSNAKAQSRLGFVPEIDFSTGAAETARWYRARGQLPPARPAGIARPQSA